MSTFSEDDVSLRLWGRSSCPYCGRFLACLATHVCSTEQALPPRPVVVDREPARLITRWQEKAKA